MITHFDYDNCRDSAVIFRSTLEQIDMLYEQDEHLAGELAIAAIHLMLTNEINSDNFLIQLTLKQTQTIANNNRNKWEARKEYAESNRKDKLDLERIAELHSLGWKQKEIAAELNVSQQVISKRLKIIQSDYPSLLEKYNQYNQYNHNVNDNVNVNVNVNDNVNVNNEEVPSIEETSFDYPQVFDGSNWFDWQDRYFTDSVILKSILFRPEENAEAISKAKELGLLQ